MVREGYIPGEPKDPEEELGELAGKVVSNEQTFLAARTYYKKLCAEKDELIAQVDASGFTRDAFENRERRMRLNEVEGALRTLDRDFFDASIHHASAVEALDEGIRSRLN